MSDFNLFGDLFLILPEVPKIIRLSAKTEMSKMAESVL